MRRGAIIVAIAVLIFAASYAGRRLLAPKPTSSAQTPLRNCRRIVSLSPGITEVLFALGLGDQVAGVTGFCDYPPAARAKPKVGGYIDPSYEAIVALRPDLVIMAVENEKAQQALDHLGVRVMLARQTSIETILTSILQIGRAGGAEARAQEMVADLRARIDRIRRETAGRPRPRVMMTIGRNMGSDSLKNLYIVGANNFHAEMIALAGGVNVYDGPLPYAEVSPEGLLRMNPQVIIDLVPNLGDDPAREAAVKKDWAGLGEIDAVKNGRLYVFGDDYVLKPGPRFILILEKLARALHPEVRWDEPTTSP